MRRVSLSLLLLAGGAGLSPAACNVFITAERCSNDLDCGPGATCDARGRFCLQLASGGGGGPAPTGQPSPGPGIAEAGVGPSTEARAPACDPAAAFGTVTPVPGLDPTLTSAHLTPDELTVLYSANPSCPAESCVDLYYARRSDLASPFGAPNPLSSVSVDNAAEYWPTVTQDETVLFFESGRSITPVGGVYTTDQSRIWTATRANIEVEFNPPTLQTLFKNIPGPEGSPYLHPNGKTLYFMSGGRGGKGSLDLFVATLDPEFGFQATSVTNLDAVNTEQAESAPTVTADNLVLYFAREDFAAKERRIWRSTRPDPAASFGAATLVTELNSTTELYEEFPSWISPDQCRLYFVSNRPPDAATDAGPSTYRLWLASRSPK